MDRVPTVSVVMITYNHEQYIEEAIRGVALQNCNFNIEFIVANDRSTDKTDQIIKKYLPNLSILNNFDVKYTNHKDNKGMIPNFIWALQQATGKYIALCEGDDYWTDPLKLQKQVDFLEKNEEHSICFHDVQILQNGTIDPNKTDFTKKLYKELNKKEALNISDLLKNNFIHTPSVVFRKSSLPQEMPFEIYQSYIGDYFLYVMLTVNNQLIHKLDDTMAVYRKGVGIFSSLTNFNMSYKVLKSSICVLSYLKNDSQNVIQLNKIMNQIDYIHSRELAKVNVDNLKLIELLKIVGNRIMKKVRQLFG